MPDRMLPMAQPPSRPNPDPIFPTIAIVGLGLVGGSLALTIREHWPSSLVIGVDDNDVLEEAMVRHAIDVAADDPVVIAEADLVVLAAPVEANLGLLDAVAEHVVTPAVVTDVGGTKRRMVERAATLPSPLTFVGGHPLAGAARQGIEHARSDLFVGRPWILTPVGDAAGEAVDRLHRFVTAVGAEPLIMTPAEHDRLAAAVVHLPQVAGIALMQAIGESAGEPGLALAGRGLVDSTRLASSPGSVWADVCRTNADEIGSQLDSLIAILQTLRDTLETDEEVARVFDAANGWRARLLATRSS